MWFAIMYMYPKPSWALVNLSVPNLLCYVGGCFAICSCLLFWWAWFAFICSPNSVSTGVVSFEVSISDHGFRLRRLAQSSVCDDSAARNGCRGILGRCTGCPRTFWGKTWFCVTGARDRMVLEDRSVSLRGRCKESDVGRRVSFEGLHFTRRAQGIRTMDAMFWGRRAWFLRRVAFLELELEDQFAWPVQDFVWPRVMIRGRRSTSETCFHFRGSLAENARFGSPDLQFSRKSRRKRSFWKSGSSVFEEVSHKTLLLKVRIFSFQGSLAEFARLQDPDASGPKGS